MTDEADQVAWTPTARRALTRLPEKAAMAAVEFIYGPLAENPQRVGKPLRFELEGLHSARRGDFRIICRVACLRRPGTPPALAQKAPAD